MKPRSIEILFALGTAAVILVAIAMQSMGPPKIDASSLHNNMQDLLSYTRESKLLILEYENGHLTRIYLQNHAMTLQRKSSTFYDELQSNTLSSDKVKDVQEIEPHIFSFLLLLKQLSESTGDKTTLQQLTTSIEKEQAFFAGEVQKYE